MEHPIFFRISLALSVTPILFGINGMLRPNAHLRALNFPAHTEPQAKKLNHALMRIWGIRNLSVGFLLTLIWTTGDERLMGKALCAGLALPITDGFVSRRLIGGGELQHWMFPPVILVVMAGLFGWFD
ncbi:hypothetical protein HIM_06056 [Hirsutella minnesotensis 3608]|uniref:Integral membrane protein n=1 Tax=Hirsutella minnesotensis 3608 TaxID=1043627 RepID=A0A0F7ZNW5_9HYPO|nr:hypothetical protein HIM_06056 [Hirsutella minnesotensis 3608]